MEREKRKRQKTFKFNQESWKIKPELLHLMNMTHYLPLMVPLYLAN